MSTDVIEQGGAGPDDGFEPPIRPPAGDLGDEGEKKPETPAVEWLPAAESETVKYLSSRGWDKDPSGLVKSQREAESALRREQEARAKIEEDLAEARMALQSNGAQGAGYGSEPGNDDPFGIVAAAEAYEGGQISMAQFAQHQTYATLQAAQQIAQEIVGQRVEPLQTFQASATMERTAAELADIYPDFADLSGDVLAMIEKHPETYGTAEGMRAAYGVVRGTRDAQQARERASATRAETLDTGSRGNGAVDAAEAVRKQLRDMGGPRDGL